MTYGSYAPEEDGNKHPLVIWIHGAGEGGTQNEIAVLGNEVTALYSEEFQNVMGGAYVLTPQTKTFWLTYNEEGDWADNPGVDSIYLESLKGLIDDYIAKNENYYDIICKIVEKGETIFEVKTFVGSQEQAKEIVDDLMEGKDPEKVVQEKGLEQVSDTGLIDSLVQKVLEENPQAIEDYKAGKDRAIGFLVGQVMKLSKGQANPTMVNESIKNALKNLL